MGSAASVAAFRRVETIAASTSSGANGVLDSNDRLYILEVDNTGNIMPVYTKGQRAGAYTASQPFDIMVKTDAGAKEQTYLGLREGFQSANGWSFITTTANAEISGTDPKADVKVRLLSFTLPS